MGAEGMDMDLDVERARAWNQEVQMEIEAVQQLLRQVAEAIEDIPASDGIGNAIYETGKRLEEAWNNVCSVLNQVMEEIRGIIDAVARMINEARERFDEFKQRIID